MFPFEVPASPQDMPARPSNESTKIHTRHRTLTVLNTPGRYLHFLASGSIAWRRVQRYPYAFGSTCSSSKTRKSRASGISRERSPATKSGNTFSRNSDGTALLRHHRCAAEARPIHPCSRGGSNRVSNLAACIPCNTDKDARPIEEFVAGKPAQPARIKAQARAPLNDDDAVNATRWALSEALPDTGLPHLVRRPHQVQPPRLGIPKVARLGRCLCWRGRGARRLAATTLAIKASARGNAQTKLTAHGCPRGYCTRTKSVRGFQTYDMVRAEAPTRKKAGNHLGRVAVRDRGSFRVSNGVQRGRLLRRPATRASLPVLEKRGFQRGRLR
jgi:hypothetical protein